MSSELVPVVAATLHKGLTVGEVPADEDFKNFERALTDGNTFSRIHFNLTPAQVKTNSQYLLTFSVKP